MIFTMLAFGTCVYAQDYTSSIVAISGASEAEELDESVLERFDYLSRHPVNINRASRSKLLSCGLFTSYQVHVITEYRAREGDILSFAELSSLGGFGPELTSALKPFISITSDALPGRSSLERRHSSDFIAKAGFKQEKDQDAVWSAGAKYRYEVQDRLLLSAAYRDELSMCAARYWHGGKLIVGDYNAKFGQGLTLWSGFSLSGLSSISAFERRGSGISPCWTFSPSSACRGLAVEQEWNRFSFAALASYRDGEVLPGANIRWFGNNSQFGVSVADYGAWSWKTSLDMRWNIHGWDVFAESAYDYAGNCLAFSGGGIWNIAYDVKLALQGRLYPESFSNSLTGALHSWTKTSDETGVSAGMQYKRLTLTLDGAYKPSKNAHQFKLLASHSFVIGDRWSLNLRFAERYRPLENLVFRSDLRADLKWDSGTWMAQLRTNLLACRNAGRLVYFELGRTASNIKLYARATYFNIPDWDDRIYVWERDAPGSFNVPAYYGHGCSASLMGSWNKRLYVRASLLSSDRSLKTDIRLQYCYDFFHLDSSRSLDKNRRSFKDILSKVRSKGLRAREESPL